VLGSVSLALATAAAVTLLLLADAWWVSLLAPTDVTSRFMQAGLTGSGLFIVAFLTNQLAARLARAEVKARRNRVEAHVQTLVNELVIDGLDDGILVIDHRNVVRAANPAARALVGRGQPARHAPFTLGSEPGWAPLADLAQFTLTLGEPQFADLTIQHVGQPRCHIHARTQLTASLSEHAESLCVMFLQDLREMEARLRTEKLAAMGRMSAAVAHEIRNPLAAIAQANALLDEDLTHPSHKQLTQMVRQNTQRLAQIVEDVLDIARVQHQHNGLPPATMELHAAVQACCDDWMRQTGCTLPRVRLALQKGTQHVVFDADHLRRVLINLLDNALRYASTSAGAIQVTTQGVASGPVSLSVWSDGAPLEQTVQRHLFEPFFSSESRSSGLGLYICRELCERHGAVIGYDRALRDQVGRRVEGNEFHVSFQPAAGVPARAPVAAPSTSS
jgi:two-component system, NtrC family, sensor histidine kinase PilS